MYSDDTRWVALGGNAGHGERYEYLFDIFQPVSAMKNEWMLEISDATKQSTHRLRFRGYASDDDARQEAKDIMRMFNLTRSNPS